MTEVRSTSMRHSLAPGSRAQATPVDTTPTFSAQTAVFSRSIMRATFGCAAGTATLPDARNQRAPARSVVPLSGDPYAAIGYFGIAFQNHVRIHVRMQGTLHEVALARHTPSAVAHGLRGGNDLAPVVSGVAESNQINHGVSLNRQPVDCRNGINEIFTRQGKLKT
ncbi:hypothetical protein BCEP4_850029 [Burkholderia cepacia]|nr:hypothetical protein BCEP4_850029 [Burkholderia cepacia]